MILSVFQFSVSRYDVSLESIPKSSTAQQAAACTKLTYQPYNGICSEAPKALLQMSYYRYMKRLVSEMSPSAGINYSDGYQATAVGKAVADGGTFVSYKKQLPKHVVYDGAARKAIEWDAFTKGKKLKVLNL